MLFSNIQLNLFHLIMNAITLYRDSIICLISINEYMLKVVIYVYCDL